MKTDASTRSASKPPTPAAGVASWLDAAAFFSLLLIVAMRPLLSEVYESAAGLFGAMERQVEITTPATTLGFDLAIWLAAIAAGLASMLGRRRWRWTGIEAGLVLMIFAAGVSTITMASNKRLALNASLDWLSAAVMLTVLAHLCRDRVRVVLVLAAIGASGLTSSARSVLQVTTEYRETREEYERNKVKLWEGVSPDDPRIELYERRMRANEATGFLSHSNVEGSLLLLSGFALLAIGHLSGKLQARWIAVALGILVFGTIPLTGSRGALLASGIGLGLWAIVYSSRTWLSRHWRAALVLSWLGVGGLTWAVVQWGQTHGGLPGSSLSFRWNYWGVAARIIRQYLWTGVGALNFDRAYLACKPIEYPEEIKDPHNFALSILAQWGLPGLIGLLMAMIGGSFVAVRRWASAAASSASASTSPAGPAAASSYGWLAAVIVGFFALRVCLLSGLLNQPSGQAYVVFDIGLYGLIWALGFAALSRFGAGPQNAGSPAGGGSTSGDDSVPLLLACALAAFLLHNCIDFSLLVPATLTVFAAIGAVFIAVRWRLSPDARAEAPAPGQSNAAMGRNVAVSGAVTVMAIAGTVFVLYFGFLPVAQSTSLLAAARSRPLPEAADYYLRAAGEDPVDPTPLFELVEQYSRAPSPEGVDLMLSVINEAIDRDPDQISLYRSLAQLHELRYGISKSESDLCAAQGAAHRAVEMYPTSPDDHLGLAELLARSARAANSKEWQEEARDQYAQALRLDAARPGTDEVRKWSPARREQIERARREVMISTTQTSPATQP